MLASLLYELYPYQIFKSVFFRAGAGYLTTYFLVSLVMPRIIHLFRHKGITSDFNQEETLIQNHPYQGATPIMGGLVLVIAILISTFLWAWLNQYTVSLLIIITSFGAIGLADDWAKVAHNHKIALGKIQQKSYSEKADGISGRLRLFLEFLVTSLVIAGIYWFSGGLDEHLHIPMIPMKSWFPSLPAIIFFPMIVFIIVGGANAVNLTDGLDTLATVPLLTCSLFVAAVAYISGDMEWSGKLKTLFISNDIKEVVIFAIVLMGAGMAFLRFNCPPAAIYMGDVGSLSLGAAVCTMFVFVKVELYLPIVGGVFVLAAISTIIQRTWFKIALILKGREWAEKNRFYYRAPYHHHRQTLITYTQPKITSVFHEWMKKIGLHKIPPEDKFISHVNINSKVVWRNHITAIWLLVICLIIYFKVR